MNTKETIKARVKELGYKLNREVSVRERSSMYDSAFEIIFRAEVCEEKIAEMQKKMKGLSSIDRCEVTGEILAGGNVYVSVGVKRIGGTVFYPTLY